MWLSASQMSESQSGSFSCTEITVSHFWLQTIHLPHHSANLRAVLVYLQKKLFRRRIPKPSSPVCVPLACEDEKSHQLLVSGRDCSGQSFIIGHTGLCASFNCSQPDPSTSESSTCSCSVLVLSFSPPNLSHTVWNQTPVTFSILITDHCWGKCKVSVNERHWLVNRFH